MDTNICILLILIAINITNSQQVAKKSVNIYGINDELYQQACNWNVPEAVRISGQVKQSSKNKGFYLSTTLGGKTYYPGIVRRRRTGQPISIEEPSTTEPNDLKSQSEFTVLQHEGNLVKNSMVLRNGNYFSQVKAFLGCPASLCMASGIDFINYKATFDEVYVQVGHHEWRIKPLGSPYVSAARPTFNPIKANAALNFPDMKYTLFLDDDSYKLMYEEPVRKPGSIDSFVYKEVRAGDFDSAKDSLFPFGFPKNVDAATVTVDKDGDYLIYAFAGEKFHAYGVVFEKDSSLAKRGHEFKIVAYNGYPKDISELDSQINGADEIYYDQADFELIIVKGAYYWSRRIVTQLEEALDVSNEDDIIFRGMHRYLFQCRDEFYSTEITPDYTLSMFEKEILKIKERDIDSGEHQVITWMCENKFKTLLGILALTFLIVFVVLRIMKLCKRNSAEKAAKQGVIP